MAGKKRRSRAGYKAQRTAYKTEGRKHKNKERKAVRHEKYLSASQSTKLKRLELLDQACEHFGLKEGRGSYLIKRLIGTPNANRLNSLMNQNILDQEWFQERRATLSKSAKKMLSQTKLAKFV